MTRPLTDDELKAASATHGMPPGAEWLPVGVYFGAAYYLRATIEKAAYRANAERPEEPETCPSTPDGSDSSRSG